MGRQVVRALDVLYKLLRDSTPREQIQAAVLEWGMEQLYCLLLNPTFGDDTRERVFKVRPLPLHTATRCHVMVAIFVDVM